jgi:hypothetical protein
MRDLLAGPIARSNFFDSSKLGSVFRTNQAKYLACLYQLVEAVCRFLMEDSPTPLPWNSTWEFVGMVVQSNFWGRVITPHSVSAFVAEVACASKIEELVQLQAPPLDLKALVPVVLSTNVMLLVHLGVPLAPKHAPTPAAAKSGGADETPSSNSLCSVTKCAGYSHKTNFACTHVFTRPCDGCAIPHARAGPRKWTCAQALALDGSAGSSVQSRGQAFKISATKFLADPSSDAAQVAAVKAAE